MTLSLRTLLVAGALLALVAGGWRKAVSHARSVLEDRPLASVDRTADSPNWDERPTDAGISCIVVHATAMQDAPSAIARLSDPEAKVSAHFVVGKDGSVVQLVPLSKRAWHAGTSVLDGVPKVNDYSIGIEVDNLNDGRDPYPDPEWQALLRLVRELRERFDIPDARVVTHAAIALPPGRKTDPLGLDMDRLRELTRP